MFRTAMVGLRRSFVAVRQIREKAHMSRRDFELSMIGNRDVVGYGMNGQAVYLDVFDFPYPAIRYKETTPTLQAMRGKERGDWRLLTCEEKKAIYRSNFRMTYAEMRACNKGEWKQIVAWAIILCCVGIWMLVWIVVYAHDKYPNSMKQGAYLAQMRRQIDLHVNPITGLASKWDYEKKDWKSHGLFTPPNPFKDKCGNYLPPHYYDEK